MTGCLLRKELRAHALGGIVVLGLLLLVFRGIVELHSEGGMQGSAFDALRSFLQFGILLGAVTLGQMLVGAEFRDRVPLFLEGLPLSRSRMFALKFLLSSAVLTLAAGLALLASIWMGRHSEWMSPRLAFILGSKTLVWTICLWALGFAAAFLGRYRLIFWTLLACLAGFIQERLHFSLDRLPPASLLDLRFGYERIEVEWNELGVGILLSAALSAGGLILGAAKNGDWAAALARPMPLREKLNLTAVVLLAVTGFVGALEREEKGRLPLLPGTERVERGVSVIEWASAIPVDDPALQERLADRVSRLAVELDDLATYLHAASLPKLILIHRPDLEAHEFKRGELDSREGWLARINLASPQLDMDRLREWVVEQALLAKSHGRAGLESQAWVLDGFGLLWSERNRETRALSVRPETLNQARKVTPDQISMLSLRRWKSVIQEWGEPTAKALSAVALASMVRAEDPGSLQAFLSELLGRDTPKDLRAWLRDVWRPPLAILGARTGGSTHEFVGRWRNALAQEALHPTTGVSPP